jgi:hypothetical protein
LSYEWKQPPSIIAAESPRMIATMYRYLRWRVLEQQKAQGR